LARRPVEEDNGDDELRKQQEIGQQLVIEDGGLFHANPIVIARSGATKQSIYPICGSMDCFASAFALRASADKSLATTSPKCLPYFAVFSKARTMALPLATASSRACWAVFLPASAASISSDQTSRICTMLPKRKPREFSVGSLLVSSFSGVCSTGFFS